MAQLAAEEDVGGYFAFWIVCSAQAVTMRCESHQPLHLFIFPVGVWIRITRDDKL